MFTLFPLKVVRKLEKNFLDSRGRSQDVDLETAVYTSQPQVG